jgi:hypothetical protein
MSYANPDILLLETPIGLDAVIQSYQQDFYNNLTWLTKSFGRAREFRNADGKYPATYWGGGEYYPVLPNDFLRAQSFIMARDGERWPANVIDNIEATLSIIFWFDLKSINPDKDYVFSEELRWEVQELISKNQYTKNISAYYDDRIEDVFMGYIGDNRGVDGQEIKPYLMYPYSGFRFDVVVVYPKHSCSAPWTYQANFLNPSYSVMNDRNYTVGVTEGAPIAGQTTFQHNDFTNRKIRLVREGLKQHPDNIDNNAYWSFVSGTGTITVNPAWIDRERISIEIFG